jgi:erythritol transport system substrate-binding protein
MKRIWFIVAVLLSVAMLTACREQGEGNLVVIITPGHENPFFRTAAEVADAKARTLGFETRVHVHDDDPVLQSHLFDLAIADRAVAIILDNAGADVSIAPIQRARDAGIPSFLIDREINATGVAVSQIVANNYQGAALVAEYFVLRMGESGDWVELVGRETDTNAHVRSDAFNDVIDQFPAMRRVARQTANWDQAEAFGVMQTLILAHPNLQGVVAGNDTMAMGAMAALLASGMGNVIVVGFDGSNDVRDSILRGEIAATGLQQIAAISELAVEQAERYLRTGTTGQPERQLVDSILITSENANRLNDFVLR